MAEQNVDRALGLHDGQIESLQQQMAELRSDVTTMKSNVESILAWMNQNKGSWKTLMFIVGVSGAAGATISKIASLLFFVPR